MNEKTADKTTRVTERYNEGDILAGRFQICHRIGRGGFATVYRGTQLNIGQPVAIKVMDVRSDRPDVFVERFLREARLAGQIQHPDVVRIIDFGLTEEDDAFMVMELLEGHSLEDELRMHGALEPARALRLMIRALDALQAAHDLHIIHRDLKPGNLFMSRIGSVSETLRILDFGIARAIDNEETDKLTATGQILGTPAFLPPEYITHNTVSPALDVYQMGLILVQMMTGRSVVAGRSLYQSMLAHVSGELDIPAELLAGPLGPVLARAITMHVEDRYEDAGHFRDALARIDPATLPPRDRLVPPDNATMLVMADTDESIIANPKATGRIVQALARGEVPEEFAEQAMRYVREEAGSPSTLEAIPPPLLQRRPLAAPANRTALLTPPDAPAEPAAPDQTASAEPRRPLGLIIGAVVAILVLGGVGGIVAAFVADEPAPGGDETGPLASAEQPPPSDERRVELIARPESAEIYDGDLLLGTGSAVVVFDTADARPVKVRVQAPGHEPSLIAVRPDQAGAPLRVELVAQEPPASAPTEPPASAEPPPGDDKADPAEGATASRRARRRGETPRNNGKVDPGSAAAATNNSDKPRSSIGFIDEDANKNKKPDEKPMGIFQ